MLDLFLPVFPIRSFLDDSLYLLHQFKQSSPTMARTKQPPMKREASAEYFNKQTGNWETSNGKKNGASNGHVKANGKADAAAEEKPAGVLQLVIAVAGIYASLWVRRIRLM